MSLATADGHTREELQTLATTVTETPETTLYDTLHNSLILSHTVPYLPISSLLRLAATSWAFRALVFQTPGVFRHLDLTQVKAVQPDVDKIDHGRNVQVDENITQDDFYSGPLRGVFLNLQRQNILQNVQTLILDGLSVTAELCHEIINDAAFNVRILSIRDVKNLDQCKLRQALQFACRTSRPKASPKLKALYVFGSKDAVPAATQSVSAGWNQKSQNALASSPQCEGDAWWSRKGRIITRPIAEQWVGCMLTCEGIIAFDAVLCHGPRHRNSPSHGRGCHETDSSPAVATFAVPACDSCGNAPEGLTHPDTGTSASLPLLTPPPVLSSSLRAATMPKEPCSSFVARCLDCIRERYCAGCQKWWCESCYQLPGQGPGGFAHPVVVVDDETVNAFGDLDLEAPTTKVKPRVSKSCWECGNNCDTCINRTQRVCRKCCAGYCIVHNEGSSATHCDWCVSRGRGLGRL